MRGGKIEEERIEEYITTFLQEGYGFHEKKAKDISHIARLAAERNVFKMMSDKNPGQFFPNKNDFEVSTAFVKEIAEDVAIEQIRYQETRKKANSTNFLKRFLVKKDKKDRICLIRKPNEKKVTFAEGVKLTDGSATPSIRR